MSKGIEVEQRATARRLVVPVDASRVDDRSGAGAVKVALVDAAGRVTSRVVKLDEKGQGRAEFELDPKPRALQVLVGPESASDEELTRLQTISQTLSTRAQRATELVLKPIAITPFYWLWWLRWCRTFVITGRVVCADGSPVPGATVCADDVDYWWWWSSKQRVGCAVTDENGSFTLRFRWCCGYRPWWWWRTRFFALEPELVRLITPVLEADPTLPRPPRPDPAPDLAIFQKMLGEAAALPVTRASPEGLSAVRDALVARLPRNVDIDRLRLWPWWPWQPWWDCSPDLVFTVTQSCGGAEKVILEEGLGSVRWNIPTALNVTLEARDACCIHDTPTPEGNCLVIARVCGAVVNDIGGNTGAAATPPGYLNPGVAAVTGDRPFAGSVQIEGIFGSGANVDYYELEWSTSSAGPYSAMPPAAAGGFSRLFWGPALGGGAVGFHGVAFPFSIVAGRLVVESREHFEANNDPLSWGTTRFWVSQRDTLMGWNTANNFSDGTYHLRVVGYAAAGGGLGPAQILPLCDTQADNHLVLSIDTATSSLEPEADIRAVRIGGVDAGPCSNVDASEGGALEVDFVAYDEDRHLAQYSLIATYGKNLAVDLLAVPGATLTPLALPGIPAADEVGPTYPAALAQGAASPHWRGGGLRLTIPDARLAFPETCCYQLELRVYKRTVVSCNYNLTPSELSFYSFTVAV